MKCIGHAEGFPELCPYKVGIGHATDSLDKMHRDAEHDITVYMLGAKGFDEFKIAQVAGQRFWIVWVFRAGTQVRFVMGSNATTMT